MLKIKQTRVKDNITYSLGEREISLAKAIDILVSAELRFGGKAVVNPQECHVVTHICGCKDDTWFTGSDGDILVLKKCTELYTDKGIKAVKSYLLNTLEISADVNVTRFNDLIALYDLYLIELQTQ